MTQTHGEQMARPSVHNSKYVFLIALLVISILLTVMALLSIAASSSRDYRNTALNAEQLRLLGQMTSNVRTSARGQVNALIDLREQRTRFDEIIGQLRDGDSEAQVTPLSGEQGEQLRALDERWQRTGIEIDTLLAGQPILELLGSFQRKLQREIPRLTSANGEVLSNLVRQQTSATLISRTALQLQRLQAIDASYLRLLALHGDADAAGQAFGQQIRQFAQELDNLTEATQRSGMDEVRSIFDTALRADAGRVVTSMDEILRLQRAAQTAIDQIDDLEQRVLLLRPPRTEIGTLELFGIKVSANVAYLLGGISLLLLFILAYLQRRDTRLQLDESERRKQETEDQNRRNQEAILRLLDELGDLAEGDLTVQASVTEDITGAIADSVNYAIEALRDLVSTINRTAEQMAMAAQDTRNVADRLAKASEVQAKQIESSSRTVMQMAQFMDDVSDKTASSAEVATKSVHIAHEGGERVRRTIQGMDAIREHIQETSKRIKRLGESSQEIGDIVALINEIADQTNILALNAAIQASAAGEAGRGFAVVADEVQRLAERSGNATRRIEALVKTIQADTNEAVISMEKSTTEVVNGAKLAQKAGEALDEIEKVSANLAELIDEISSASGQVTEMAARVSGAMASINDITAQTAESSIATASSINKLNNLAQELQQSVAGFRLPEAEGAAGDHIEQIA